MNKTVSLPRKQAGFTLLEVLIASTLGLIVIAGIVALLTDSRSTYRVQESISELQENGRFGLLILKKNLQQAGWKDPGPLETEIGTLPEHILLDGGTLEGGAAAANDSVKVTFNGATDCTNAAVADGVVENTFSVVGTDLVCTGKAGGTQTVVENVDSLQFLYGIDNDNDGAPNFYAEAGSISRDTVHEVVSVRIGLLLSSSSAPADQQSRSFQVLNESAVTYTDKKLRRLYTTTVMLPNKPKQI